MSSPAQSDVSPTRLKAEGFPRAPIIEAVIDVQFAGGLSEEQATAVKTTLGQFYASSSEAKQTGFSYDISEETLNVQAGRTVYTLAGRDQTEVAIVRPEGIAATQLAPYKSWDLLIERFARDWTAAEKVIGSKPVARIAVRYINRIDVPLDEQLIAHHEDYLVAHVNLPSEIQTISDFYLRFAVDLPDIGAVATVQSAVMPDVVEGKGSFALDIDVAKAGDLGSDRLALIDQLSGFREPKNWLYQKMLTDRALKEFQ